MKQFNNRKSHRGFTLIELLIVIAILGILSVAVVTALNIVGNLNKGTLAIAKTFNASVENALSINQVGKWSFEETTSPSKDTSGYNNNGTWGGAVTSKTPEECGLGFRRCVEFDGINGYIEIPDNSPINFLNKSTITVGAWIKVNSLLSGQTSLVHKWSGYVMETTFSSPWKFRWTLQTTVGYLTIMSTTTISPNVWYFIVGTYDGSTTKLYLNGTLEATGSHSGTISDSGNSLRLGCRSDAAPCAEPFGGLLDEVAIYNEALTFSQIQQLYAQGFLKHLLAGI